MKSHNIADNLSYKEISDLSGMTVSAVGERLYRVRLMIRERLQETGSGGNASLSCDDFTPLISKLLDGELKASERMEVQSHLDACEDCRNLAQDWRLQGKVLRTYFIRHAFSEEFIHRVRTANQAGRQATPETKRETKRVGFLGHRPSWWLSFLQIPRLRGKLTNCRRRGEIMP